MKGFARLQNGEKNTEMYILFISFTTSCCSPLRGCPLDIRLMAHPVPAVPTYVDGYFWAMTILWMLSNELETVQRKGFAGFAGFADMFAIG
jgi:hypothetical protein